MTPARGTRRENEKRGDPCNPQQAGGSVTIIARYESAPATVLPLVATASHSAGIAGHWGRTGKHNIRVFHLTYLGQGAVVDGIVGGFE